MCKGFIRQLRNYFTRNRLGELLVIGGIITPRQLQYALVCQRASRLPLGRVLVQEQLIRRRQLYHALARQTTFRIMAGALTLTLSLCIFGVRAARAGDVGDIPAQLRLAGVANAAFTPVAYYPPILHSSERMSSNLRPFTKWTQMFARLQASMDTPEGRKETAVLKAELAPLVGQPLQVMAERVNALMNQEPYIEDSENWGVSDYWETPVEFLSRGGDCEDFAIAKYVSLRALGVPEDRLRLVIVRDMLKGLPHAVLAVYTDTGPVILDNQSHTVKSSDALVGRYKPIFSINQQGWWLHTPKNDTMLASAQ